MVLLVASQIHLGKLSETGKMLVFFLLWVFFVVFCFLFFFFSMSLSSTKSVCNSLFAILTSASPFSSTFEFFRYELPVN